MNNGMYEIASCAPKAVPVLYGPFHCSLYMSIDISISMSIAIYRYMYRLNRRLAEPIRRSDENALEKRFCCSLCSSFS